MLSYLLISMASDSETTRWSELAMCRHSESDLGFVDVVRFFVERSAGVCGRAISQSADIVF